LLLLEENPWVSNVVRVLQSNPVFMESVSAKISRKRSLWERLVAEVEESSQSQSEHEDSKCTATGDNKENISLNPSFSRMEEDRDNDIDESSSVGVYDDTTNGKKRKHGQVSSVDGSGESARTTKKTLRRRAH
jgi:hypothetical protein